MIKYFVILFIILFHQNNLNSQISKNDSSSISFLIYSQLPDADEKKLLKLDKLENKATKLLKASDSYFEQCNSLYQKVDNEKNKKSRAKILKKTAKLEKKAIKNHVSAIELYNDAFVQKYKIFKHDLRKFFILKKELVDSASKLELNAYNNFELADLNIQKTFYQVNSNDVFETLTQVYNAQKLGLLNQQLMYALFLEWDNLLISKIRKEIKNIDNNYSKTSDKDETIAIKDSVNLINIIVYDTVLIERRIPNVTYKIQIAASKKPLDKLQLKTIYKNTDLIEYELEGGWYKYSVGYFNSYKDAQEFKLSMGVKDAFITSYLNGIKTPLKNLINHPSFNIK